MAGTASNAMSVRIVWLKSTGPTNGSAARPGMGKGWNGTMLGGTAGSPKTRR